ncbi:glycogen debranching N-terminal domain-containing protein [Micropruina sonneratiae]|uniref:glycogen debranching N-terminal domain-containing protein n=1 Tax=Micropruina sonneratiae TaxID=2986940 RepID=UPI00222721C5|nr:glycogen debranching N-terminal domain-containing protein [Micropruina sp. KQZ13P-5]MCW3159268.1 amylo-alpha-16-glucosidase [Micropruina sp. KQZ13P-5]
MALHQPFLHDLTVALAAPVQVWSAAGGDVDGSGVQGFYYGDHRVLQGVSLRLDGPDGPVDLVAGSSSSGLDGAVTFHAIARLGEGVDPCGSVTRRRAPHTGGVRETITVAGSLPEAIEVELVVEVTPDVAPLNLIRAGVDTTGRVEAGPDGWGWDECSRVRIDAPGAQVRTTQAGEGALIELRWRLTLPRYGSVSCGWELLAADAGSPFEGCTAEPVAAPALRGASASLERLVRRSVADLNALRMQEPGDADRRFYAAGAPWFFTLFGRDSLIAARLALPLDASMALGTLHTLAARQGRVVDVDRAEQPGKILHEVRADTIDLQRGGIVLPPEYYGTIDATPLWILLLAEVDAAGHDVGDLIGALQAALGWLRDFSDADGDGFAEYFDASGHGLANQGWKDSGDSIRFSDGRIAQGPIALAEVQGYCHAAALAGAGLLERHTGDAAQAAWWREWAGRLADRFRASFWVTDEHGRYPALALDADKAPVDTPASNMGHLLGTGLLDAAEEAIVVDRLMSPELFSGYGIRTVSTSNAAYWPTRYHVGSVWTHDTAMILDGMLRSGFDGPAARLAQGLLRAAEGFEYRLPELFGGQGADEVFPPVPYPASCRPQAWAAASGVSVARALGAL